MLRRFLPHLGALALAVALALSDTSVSAASEPVQVGGILSQDTTWAKDDGPFVITSTVQIQPGVTLTIEPGTTVSTTLTTGSLFRVAGVLHATGSPDEPVRFADIGRNLTLAGQAYKTTPSTASGVLTLEHTQIGINELVSGPLSEVALLDSAWNLSPGGAKFDDVDRVLIQRSSISAGNTSLYTIRIAEPNEFTSIIGNRWRGTSVTYTTGLLVLRENTFERFPNDYGFFGRAGSQVASSAGCTVDARRNFWESGSPAAQIHDAYDSPSLTLVNASDPIEAPAAGTPALPPGYVYAGSMQVSNTTTGLAAWWNLGTDGGSPMTGRAEAIPVGSQTAEQTVENAHGYARFLHLDITKTYFIRITVSNAIGSQTFTSSRSYVPEPTATTPGPPTDLRVNLGPRSATLSWTPGADGGARIRYFQFSVEQEGGGSVNGSGGDQTSWTVSDLIPGAKYSFSVSAVNDMGDGEPATFGPFTAIDVPTAPSSVEATAGDRQARVTWRPSAEQGTATRSYVITSSPGGRTVTVPGAQNSAVVPGLANGTGYTFAVRATNTLGSSAWSRSSAGATPYGSPLMTGGVKVRQIGKRLVVSWRPAAANGSPVLRYVVTMEPRGLVTTKRAGTTEARFGGLTAGRRYKFTVKAINAAGDSRRITSDAVRFRG